MRLTKQRFKVIPAVYLILVKDNKILLMRRFNTGYNDGNYSLPAGHLEGNESMKNAMVRETAEETGLTIQPEDLVLAHVIHQKTESIDNERLDLFFTPKDWQGNPKIVEPNKCDEIGWFPLDKLPSNIIPKVKAAIENTFKGIPYSEFDWER